MTTYLLDTNYLIYLIDEKADADKKQEIRQDFEIKVQQEDTRFVITPLIRYETLRGIEWENEEKLVKISVALENFPSLEITQDAADLARDWYRFDSYLSRQNPQVSQRNLDKRKFDIFHYAVAYTNNIELFSKDKDINSIKNLHQKMEQDEET